ncbi:MAG: LLM class F420-dependent oxidoreductase [Acidimicrobiia bacterium]
MDFRIFTEPQQGATYDTLLAVARRSEALGFDGFFRSDHYLSMGSVSGLPGPTDAWITLAGLARDTSRVRLGTLVTPATFRSPGVLAISVANVDQMSGGRVELGLGAGWYEAEHHAYALGFPDVRERFDRLEEQLAIVNGLWATPSGQRFEHAGRYYSIVDSPALPKPVQSPRPPIIVGGGGPRRTPLLAAKYADEFNRAFRPITEFVDLCARVRAACESIGRDPNELVYSVGQVVCVGRTAAELAARAGRIGREVDELRENGLAGTPDEVLAKLRAWRDAGAQRVYFQVLDLDDLEHLDLIAELSASV